MTDAQLVRHYDPTLYVSVNEFDEQYFSSNVEHNLVCGVPRFAEVEAAMPEIIEEIDPLQANRYTRSRGGDNFRLETARRMGVAPENVIACAGGTGGLLLALMSVAATDGELVVFDPDYPGYRKIAALLGLKVRPVKRGQDAEVDLDRLAAALGPTSVAIVLSNPCNPTGGVIDRSTRDGMISLAERYNVTIIADEVYADYVAPGSFHSFAQYPQHAIVVRSFSKSHGLAGWRIGFCLTSSSRAKCLADIQEYTFVCPSRASQWIATAVADRFTVDEPEFQARRVQVCDALQRAGIEFTPPQGGFFVWVKIPQHNDKDFVSHCFSENLAILPGSLFSTQADHVRLAFAHPSWRAALGHFCQIFSGFYQ